jgi:hypothetical protein
MAKGEMISSLRNQGTAILVMVSIAVLSVLGMVVLGEFDEVKDGLGLATNINTTADTAIAAFIAGFALVGTFATITMLVIVVKALIGIVRGLR